MNDTMLKEPDLEQIFSTLSHTSEN